MAIEIPSPLSAPSWTTLSPSTPSIQWRTSLLRKSISIFRECTPAKQTELPVEPHLCRPFSGEAWRGPAPQEKDGPPLLRWSPHPYHLHESSYSVSPVQPTLDSQHPPSPAPPMQLLSGRGIGLFLLAVGSAPIATFFQQALLARGGESFHVSCFLPGKGALLR